MPSCTGFTSKIVNGKITTAEAYLKLCLYGFSILLDWRDKPWSDELPDEIPLHDYHTKNIEAERKTLSEISSRTDDEWREHIKKKLAEEKATYEKVCQENKELIDRINPIHEKIEAWNCDEKYVPVKKFALEQLQMTTPTNTDWFEKIIAELEHALEDDTALQKYKADMILSANRSLQYTLEEADREQKTYKESNEYLAGFKKEIAALGMTEDEHRSKVYEILEKKHGRKVNFEMNEEGNYDCFIEDCYKEGINPEYVADGIVNAEDSKKRWSSERLTVNIADRLKAAADKIQSIH